MQLDNNTNKQYLAKCFKGDEKIIPWNSTIIHNIIISVFLMRKLRNKEEAGEMG